MTRQVLNYHHPDDSQFSLSHVTDDRNRHEKRATELAEDESCTVRRVTENLDDTTAYLIYINTAPDTALPDLETDDDLRRWLQETFKKDTLPIVLAIWRAYRGILDEEKAAGNKLDLYKQMQLEKIPDIIERVEWKRPVPAVATDLLSEFILAHPMPNTNHRTGISLIERYFTSVEGDFMMPPTGETDKWYPWVVDYIYDSKRILTLRRKTPVFRYASALGYRMVQRKEGVTIDLKDINLDRTDAFDHYSEKHHTRTQTFIKNLIEQADETELLNKADDGKQSFVDRLRADQ